MVMQDTMATSFEGGGEVVSVEFEQSLESPYFPHADDSVSLEDLQSVASDTYCFDSTSLLLCKEKAMWVEESQNKDADHYVSYFNQKDLNPFTTDEQVPRQILEDDEVTYVGQGVNQELPFCAFDAFARKYSPKEDGSLEEHTQYDWSPNQAYFFQKQKHKVANPSNDKGGFYGLVQRSAKGDRKDINALCKKRRKSSIQAFQNANKYDRSQQGRNDAISERSV